MKLFFITGVTGFIGQRLARALKGNVRVLSRSNILDFETIVCDLGKDIIPHNALKGVDTVFHLAGLAHDSRDEDKIKDIYQKVNVDATVQLANLAIQSGVKKFVYISSVKAEIDSTNEKYSYESKDIYGKTKREAELKLLKMSHNSNMMVSIIRPSLVYGPNVKGNLQKMLVGIKKGWFPPLPETGNKRSMVHVDDLVLAILFVANDSRTNGEIYNVTDGKSYSSSDIYKSLCQLNGKVIPRWILPVFVFNIISKLSPHFKYKVKKLLGSEFYSSKKIELLGFKPKKTLKDMNETDF